MKFNFLNKKQRKNLLSKLSDVKVMGSGLLVVILGLGLMVKQPVKADSEGAAKGALFGGLGGAALGGAIGGGRGAGIGAGVGLLTGAAIGGSRNGSSSASPSEKRLSRLYKDKERLLKKLDKAIARGNNAQINEYQSRIAAIDNEINQIAGQAQARPGRGYGYNPQQGYGSAPRYGAAY